MFPMGIVGIALLILRLTVATMLIVDGYAQWSQANLTCVHVMVVVTVSLLCLGILTPYCSVLCVLLALWTLWDTRGQNGFHLIMFVLISLVTAVLGPGAYSVDARLFGRRLLTATLHESRDDE